MSRPSTAELIMLLDYYRFEPECDCAQCNILHYLQTGRCPCVPGECTACDGIGSLFGQRCDRCLTTGREPKSCPVQVSVPARLLPARKALPR